MTVLKIFRINFSSLLRKPLTVS